ncbi:MAG: response regulator, partial [Dysosmobacter sp.]|nr:response regulator [Dysosmobacter sp.]
ANIGDPQQVQNCLKKITLSSRHLLGLINDVLDMSKIESGRLTLNMDQVSLREVMDSIVSIAQPQVRSKRQHFDVFIHDISTENVCCDSVRLNQVLLNILGNALKFTPEGGLIQVSLYEEPSPKGEDYVRTHILVKDNGIGMTPEFKEKIFESFVREDSARVRRTEGSGLGMAITKYIVDAMGGSITVESELGKGSEFHVTLDLQRAEATEEEMILPDWNILVVDDDQQLCESTTASLKSIGVKADWALNAEKALEMLDRRVKARDNYHIILLDWKLPDMDGISAAKEIRRRFGGDTPIMLISAYDWSEIESEARDAGITGFISKPLFRSTLFYGLKPFIGGAGVPGPQRHEEKCADFTGRHILLAEDNDLNWEIANELLSDLGMELEWAENGRICVDMFENSPVGFYDAVLMDLRMPVMTGYEATRAIRSLDRPDRDIPIIAMTADAFSEDIKKCLAAGMNAHVAKPIDIREVSRLLDKFISQRH